MKLTATSTFFLIASQATSIYAGTELSLGRLDQKKLKLATLVKKLNSEQIKKLASEGFYLNVIDPQHCQSTSKTVFRTRSHEVNPEKYNELVKKYAQAGSIDVKQGDSPLRAYNHITALDYVSSLAAQRKQEITLKDIFNIHRQILKNIDDYHAGTFRQGIAKISCSNHPLPLPDQVPDLMQEYIEWLNSTNDHPIFLASQAHVKLVIIHPFFDGNGRTARLIMNFILMRNGYPPIFIPMTQKGIYCHSIKNAEVQNKFSDFTVYVYQAMDRSLDIYLKAVQSIAVS